MKRLTFEQALAKKAAGKKAVTEVIKQLKEGWGANCKASDLDEFPEMYKKGKLSQSIRHGGRCGSCQAKECIDFLKKHSRYL